MKDLTGQKFGELTVIRDTGKRTKRYSIIWECKCSCGETCEADGRLLVKGHKKSCGHLHRTVKPGEKYGMLTVVQLTDKRTTGGDIICLCKCDCGKEVEINSHSMKQGLVASCGCYLKITAANNGRSTMVDLTNKKFGKLTALYPTDVRNGSNVKWMCRCDCGNMVLVSTDYFKRGRNISRMSCGCSVSHGEEKITKLLRENNIKFKIHYRVFIEKNKNAVFDVGVLNDNGDILYFIEYDGEQHFSQNGGWNTKERFDEIRNSDKLKNEWCINNQIPLIRIPYTQYNDMCIQDLIPGSRFLIVEA